MAIEVQFNGIFRDKTEKYSASYKGVKDVAALSELLHKEYPQIKDLQRTYFINGKQATESDNITKGDKIMIIPPFAGG